MRKQPFRNLHPQSFAASHQPGGHGRTNHVRDGQRDRRHGTRAPKREQFNLCQGQRSQRYSNRAFALASSFLIHISEHRNELDTRSRRPLRQLCSDSQLRPSASRTLIDHSRLQHRKPQPVALHIPHQFAFKVATLFFNHDARIPRSTWNTSKECNYSCTGIACVARNML